MIIWIYGIIFRKIRNSYGVNSVEPNLTSYAACYDPSGDPERTRGRISLREIRKVSSPSSRGRAIVHRTIAFRWFESAGEQKKGL